MKMYLHLDRSKETKHNTVDLKNHEDIFCNLEIKCEVCKNYTSSKIVH